MAYSCIKGTNSLVSRVKQSLIIDTVRSKFLTSDEFDRLNVQENPQITGLYLLLISDITYLFDQYLSSNNINLEEIRHPHGQDHSFL